MALNSKIFLVALFLALTTSGIPAALPQAKDYYVFGYYRPGGASGCYGPGGFIDETNAVGRGAGKEYLAFSDGSTGYLFEVKANGDPTLHPQDPEHTGPVAPREFTLVSKGSAPGNTTSAYVIDKTGIYHGAYNGIRHWDFQWHDLGNLGVDPPPGGTQTFTRNYDTGDWWCGTAGRAIYRVKNGQKKWKYIFTYPDLQGSHQDGMTYANGSLFISDMTSDHIIQYRLDKHGKPIDPGNTPFNKFDYSAAPVVENMGIGPFYHIWVNGGWGAECYELGGGKLQQFLNKAPKIDLFLDNDNGPAPLTVEFDASGSKDEDGWIAYWEWDFDNDGKVDLAGSSQLSEEAKNIGGIPFSDPARGFTCSTGKDINANGTLYCKYNNIKDSITEWFNNIEKFKGEGIKTVEELVNQKLDPYIGGNTTENKIKTIRELVTHYREECIQKPYYIPPTECSHSCKVANNVNLRLSGVCITPDKIKSILDEQNSPAAPFYQDIFDLGKQKGIDPAIALAFFAITSNYGKKFDLIKYTYWTQGNYTVKLTVVDNNGLKSSDTAPIKVLPPVNRPPVAILSTIPTSGFAPLTVDFDASQSHDPDNDILSYQWTFSDKPRPAIQGKKKFSVVFQNDTPITVILTVKDPSGKTSHASVEIRPKTQIGISRLIVAKTYAGEKAQLKVECTHDIPVKLSLFEAKEKNKIIPLAENEPYTCNLDAFRKIGPALKGGVYLAKAEINEPNCNNCLTTLYFFVPKPVKKIKSPETSPALTILIAAGVLFIVGKRNCKN